MYYARNGNFFSPRRYGFTLVELLIVIAIFTVIAAFSIPFAQTLQSSSDAKTHADVVLTMLRRAHDLSVTGRNASGWGVYFDSGTASVILYRGNSYVARDTAFDEIYSLPPTLTVSPSFGSDVSFGAYSGLPTTAGTVTISGQTGSITILV